MTTTETSTEYKMYRLGYQQCQLDILSFLFSTKDNYLSSEKLALIQQVLNVPLDSSIETAPLTKERIGDGLSWDAPGFEAP